MTDPSPRSRRFFVSDTGSSRRPIDLTIAAAGVVLVLLSGLAVSDGGGPLDSAVQRVAGDLPDWVTSLFDAAYALGAAYAAVAVLLALATAPRRRRLFLTLLVAAGIAVGAVLLTSFLVGAGWPDLAPGPVRSSTPDTFPTVRVAAMTAVLLAMRPWLVLAYRRLSMFIVAVQCLAAWIIGTGGPTDVIGALGVGMVAAGAALVLLGSPAGHPDLAQVRRSLAELDVEAHDLRFAERQPWGVRVVEAVDPAGTALTVKVYGRDATDAHRAARWWRTLVYRDQAAPDASRLQLVEHEALVTVLASRAGVVVPDVVAAAATEGDAVLVLTAPPARPTELDDATLRALWDAVGRLHRAGIVHTRLTLERIGVATDGTVTLADFADGRIAATEPDRNREVATLLTAQAVQVGAGRAVDAALDRLGPDAVSGVLPYLQRAALPRTLRAEPGVKAALADLGATIVERTGVPAPAPAPIVRLKWQDLLQTGLILVAAYALLTTLIGLDWPTVLETWQHATWTWVAIGLVIAQATAPVDAVSTMSAVPSRLPLWPLTQLQYAIKTVGLAISATAGRIALTTSFVRRFGEGPAVAVTASALDSFAASVCNVLVVLIGVLLAQNLPSLDIGGPDDLSQIIELLVGAVVLSVLVVVLVPPVRRKVAQAARSSWESLKVVTASPARALLMFGTNLASLLITAVALSCMVAGLQPGPGYAACVFVVGGAALFSALIPVPGNVGVGEAALAAGLVAVGVPSGAAFAIAVTQRIATSYLPPVYGAWALRWLRTEDYVS
ncbi:lysylphosphatidylglycerol synthase domain-containing protein [Nocardioides sp. URHA0032]|uniref:lysylphosphatidylglycerol synthase domain-containing protein n=1 Tax=Nocardioides sp. URHA0032 TaxID=1380388 RepID=UPI00055CCB28|nr:lysylphosphatidylglycerol synthase domain-containing protein [Nocardioides sp. URHA0032]